jgi:hypothetical protein
MSHKRQLVFDCALAFVLTALLVLPWFRIAYLDNWMSIEGSFIADARYILDQWPHPRWHALWYCGTRFDYVYPPLTRYGAAIASRIFHVVPAQGYHIYIALMYCLGVAGVYFLVRIGGRSRHTAWIAAAAHALLSPVYLLLKSHRDDSLLMMPQRLNVMLKWGEGPHMSAFAIIPWAIGLSLYALGKGHPITLAAAGVASAMVVSNNFYGAFALAIFFFIATFAVWITHGQRAVWWRAATIVLLAYGLCAWWLVPSYFKLTARNLMLVALPGTGWSKWLALLVAAGFLAAAWRRGRNQPEFTYTIFLWGSLLIFGLEVLGSYWLGFRVIGEPLRFVPELDLLLNLALVEGLRRLWLKHRRVAVVATLACFSASVLYLSRPWAVFRPDRDYRSRIEYRLTEWIAQNLPGARTFATGSIRFWYTTWRDIAQVGGASDQGMESLMPALAQWQLVMGDDPRRDVDWLIALGSDAIVTHEQNSQEIYHHMQRPRKFVGLLPLIYDRSGDIIYRVPRRFPGLARVVDETRMRALQPIPWSNENAAQLRAYAEAIEASDSPVTTEWQGISALRLRGRTMPGESVLVQVTADPGWHAYAGGRPLEVQKDILGFMRIRTPPGQHDILLTYELPLECRVGRIVALLAVVVIMAMVVIIGR